MGKKKSAAKKSGKKKKKTTKKKTAKKKTTKKKAAKKKTMTKKKTAKKKTAKKAPTKKTTKKKTGKKTTSKKKTEKKAATKKKTAKMAADAKTAKKRAKTKGGKESSTGRPTTGVTVQIGASKPKLAVAPGAMIARQPKRAAAQMAAEQGDVPKLTRKELNAIREMLLAKREQLLHGMRRELADHRERRSNVPADDADKASDAYDETLSFEIASTSDEEADEIEAALDKIDDGTYGECVVCGCQIAPSRLKVLPFATACKSCRDLKERARRRGDNAVNWGIVNETQEDDE